MEDANITTVFQRFSPANFPFPGDAGDDGLACPQQAAAMVNTREIPPEAILLGVYLELQNGWFSTTLAWHRSFINVSFYYNLMTIIYLC